MIQRLLTSYIRRKRGVTNRPPEPSPRTVPFATEPRSPSPSDLPQTGFQGSKGHQSHDFDVSMAESRVAFGTTMCLHDLDEGALTPPSCAASVPIPADLAKAIEEELKASSRVLGDSEQGTSCLTTRPAAGMSSHFSEAAVQYPIAPIFGGSGSVPHCTFALTILTTRLYAQSECAKYQIPQLLRWQLLLYRRVRNKFKRTRLRLANGSASPKQLQHYLLPFQLDQTEKWCG